MDIARISTIARFMSQAHYFTGNFSCGAAQVFALVHAAAGFHNIHIYTRMATDVVTCVDDVGLQQ